MRWGVLFRREISLTYARIQDIHLASNILERWLGLARVEVQTAAGAAKAEMTIEGLPDFEALRDFLYTRMQGAKGSPRRRESHRPAEPSSEVVDALREAAAELKALREEIAAGRDAAR
jgi:putative membrane protein